MATTLISFAEKKYEKLLHCFSHFFLQKNINIFENALATSVNKFVIDELVKLMLLLFFLQLFSENITKIYQET